MITSKHTFSGQLDLIYASEIKISYFSNNGRCNKRREQLPTVYCEGCSNTDPRDYIIQGNRNVAENIYYKCCRGGYKNCIGQFIR